jgi:outer membrane protein OmpA-like peptidoglycan-associated protein
VRTALEGLAPDFAYEASGKGETEPVAPNETEAGADDEAGRALNRRVTITFAKTT